MSPCVLSRPPPPPPPEGRTRPPTLAARRGASSRTPPHSVPEHEGSPEGDGPPNPPRLEYVRISFLSTPQNLQRLPKIPSQLGPLIHFVSFPLPKVEGLPAAAESTTDVLPDEIQFLKKAFDGLDSPFSKFLKEASPKPDWILHDFGHHWLPPIASKFTIPCAFLAIVPASFMVFMGPTSELKHNSRWTPEQFIKLPEWISFPTTVAYCLHEAKWMA